MVVWGSASFTGPAANTPYTGSPASTTSYHHIRHALTSNARRPGHAQDQSAYLSRRVAAGFAVQEIEGYQTCRRVLRVRLNNANVHDKYVPRRDAPFNFSWESCSRRISWLHKIKCNSVYIYIVIRLCFSIFLLIINLSYYKYVYNNG